MKTKGLVIGSFNPMHNEHINIIKFATLLVDEVIVVIATNTNKDVPIYAELTYNVAATNPLFNNVQIEWCQNQTIQQIISEYGITHVFRGIRSGSDLDEETALRQYLEDFAPQVQVVWYPGKFPYISSSLIRGLVKLPNSKHIVEQMVPEEILFGLYRS